MVRISTIAASVLSQPPTFRLIPKKNVGYAPERAGGVRPREACRQRTKEETIVLKNYEVVRLSGSLGAEVYGTSLARVDATEADAIRELLHEHLVLFFPDQHLDQDAHIAFGRHFGRLEGHPNLENPFSKGAGDFRACVITRRHRRRVAQRPHFPVRTFHHVDPQHGQVSGGRRGHDVGEHVQSLRGAVTPAA